MTDFIIPQEMELEQLSSSLNAKRRWETLNADDTPLVVVRKKVKVARHVPNTYRPPPLRLYAFVYSTEANVDAHRRTIYNLECLDMWWFLRVWTLEMHPDVLPLARLFRDARGVDAFDKVFFGEILADRGLQDLAFRSHAWFTKRMLRADDPAPVSLLHVIGPRRSGLAEGYWYSITTGPRQAQGPDSLEEAGNWVALHSELALHAEMDPDPLWCHVTTTEFDWYIDNIAKILHLPQSAPPPLSVAMEEEFV